MYKKIKQPARKRKFNGKIFGLTAGTRTGGRTKKQALEVAKMCIKHGHKNYRIVKIGNSYYSYVR